MCWLRLVETVADGLEERLTLLSRGSAVAQRGGQEAIGAYSGVFDAEVGDGGDFGLVRSWGFQRRQRQQQAIQLFQSRHVYFWNGATRPV